MSFVPGRFSVVVPSFQQGVFLERTLESVFCQNDPAVEIIVQDGGSTDQSMAILQRYGDRLRWESKPDSGQSGAINAGFHKSTGEFLCYLNSDDVLRPDALRQVRAVFNAQPATQIVYGLADFIDEHDQVLGPYPVEPWNYARLRETCFISQPSCFWRRSVYERFGPFDEALHYTMDYEYWLRVGAAVAFEFLPVCLSATRCHPGAKTFGNGIAASRERMELLQRHHAGRIPPAAIISYARHCAETRLRPHATGFGERSRFAFAYWRQLLALAPRVTAGGTGVLRRKLAPPYPSARRRVDDPVAALTHELR